MNQQQTEKISKGVKEISDTISDIIAQLENANEKVFAMVGNPQEGISKELNTIRREIQSIINRLYSTWGGVLKIWRGK